jgi:two-component system, cell cycle response regulator DivK
MSRSILLVDDYEDGLDMYREYLTYRAYQVVVARTGEEAIAQARRHRPDVILMDIRMPVMTGTDAMRVLRADPSFQRTPIIALTAHALDGERRAALAAGFDEIIAKPCLPDQLVLAIERCCMTPRESGSTDAGEALYWSKHGIVACSTHAPALESDMWRLQGWQEVPAWRHTISASILQCQFCHGRPYVRQVRRDVAGAGQ